MNDDHFTSPHLDPSERGNLGFDRVTRQCQDKNSFFLKKLFIFCGQLERKQVPHLSHTRDIRDGEGVHECLSVWKGERARERSGEGGRERCSRLLGT